MSFHLGRVTDGENRIRKDFIEFSRLWLQVKEDWLDERCQRYEHEHLSSIGPSLNRFTGALHEFCDSVRKAEQALKDDFRPGDELE